MLEWPLRIGKVVMVTQEEIEQAFVVAGWELDGSFFEHLIIGEAGDLSVLAPRWTWGAEDPVFELCDGEREVTYWVREIPTPPQAAALLDEHGGPPEEERGNPYNVGRARS
jgi:hypothetical protein